MERTALATGTFDAMGSSGRVLAPSGDLPAALATVQALFHKWDAELSRFRPDSGVSRLNQTAGSPTVVSRLVFRVLQEALAASAETDGAFDPTLGQRLVDLGFDRPFAELPRLQPPASLPPYRGGHWRDVRMDASTLTVTLPAGVAVDLGGIAKSMALDAAVEQLQRQGLTCALVEAGGDVAVLGRPPGQNSWPVRVDGGWSLGAVSLCEGALATSGSGRRTWQQGRQRRHDILDPVTGEPAQHGLIQVTVAAPHAGAGAVAAKVALIRGIPQGLEFLEDRGWPGLWLEDTGGVGVSSRWPWPIGATS